jgi:hypothetical protein
MDTPTAGIALLALLLLLAAAGVAALVFGWRRVMKRAGTLQIWRAMERRGLRPEDAAGEERALALAVRHCTMCGDVEQCEHWLAGKRDDPDAFCPNTTFMENLQRGKQQAAARQVRRG